MWPRPCDRGKPEPSGPAPPAVGERPPQCMIVDSPDSDHAVVPESQPGAGTRPPAVLPDPSRTPHPRPPPGRRRCRRTVPGDRTGRWASGPGLVAQRGRQPVALGDVTGSAARAHEGAMLVLERRRADPHVDDGPVLLDPTGLQL